MYFVLPHANKSEVRAWLLSITSQIYHETLDAQRLYLAILPLSNCSEISDVGQLYCISKRV